MNVRRHKLYEVDGLHRNSGRPEVRAIAHRARPTRGATPTIPGGDLKLWTRRD